MTNVTPLHERSSNNDSSLDLQDLDGVGERFKTFFEDYISQKKQNAVASVLKEEFPAFAGNARFAEAVLNRLNDSCVKEKRFVFLVMNPNRKS